MPIAGQLNDSQVTQNEQAAQTLGNAGIKAISSNQFTYFAAFDGTNNDKDNLSLAGDPQQTNAAQLYDQVKATRESNVNLAADYFRGVGTDGKFDLSAAFADVRVEANAQEAYTKFALAAKDWLVDNPGGSVTTAIVAFSRGGPTAIRFAQLLNEKGLVAPDGTELIPKGQVPVAAMALIDPVGTTVADSKSVIPDNVNRDNFIVVGANNEYLGSEHRVEQFTTADGKRLLDGQVEQLVQAMAAFAPPEAGQTALPTPYRDSLAPVIAANWH